jgi:hypothetical protein
MKKFKERFFCVTVAWTLLCAVMTACGGSPAPVAAQPQPAAPVEELAIASRQSAAQEDNLDAAIRETSDYLNKQLSKGNKLMILNVQSEFPALSEYIIDELIANTVNDRVFSVVDRQQLNTIRAELDFQMSGEVDDETAQSLGRMAGAQIIISGAVSQLGDLYRLRVRALSVQSAQIEGQFNRNIPNGITIAALVRSRAIGYGGESQGSAARSARPAAPAGTAAAPVSVATAAQPAAPGADYKIGQKGPAGGFVFYDNEPSPVSQAAPTTETYTVGQNGPAGGLTFYDSEPRVILAAAPVHTSVVYKVGDKGPAGGFIFYVNPSASDGWRYLEAAPASTEGKNIQWAANGGSVRGTSTEAGTGKQNTQAIMNHALQSGENMAAARLCDRLQSGGYDDWYLPSKVELGIMYLNLKMDGIGGFGNDWYWSSSESGIDSGVWIQNFGNGQQYDDGLYAGSSTEATKTKSHNVRAIRQF